ncbi:MAG: hypothetical protein M3N53_09075 [Actinomycetota bacterium]|nr:hypothetical protein [Actinomycetota bacterium]
MRCRLALLLVAALTTAGVLAPIAHAAPTVSAQVESEAGQDVENEGGDQADVGTDTGEGADTSEGEDDLGEGGEGEPSAETGAGAGEQLETEEEGPQWTYQMSKITLVLLLLLFLAMGGLYYKMIGSRQRGRV